MTFKTTDGCCLPSEPLASRRDPAAGNTPPVARGDGNAHNRTAALIALIYTTVHDVNYFCDDEKTTHTRVFNIRVLTEWRGIYECTKNRHEKG